MRRNYNFLIAGFLLLFSSMQLRAQDAKGYTNMNDASNKIEKGFKQNNSDTLAQGYFDFAEGLYQKGQVQKSEYYFNKAKELFTSANNLEGIVKSSRYLAKVQEELHKNNEAISNYKIAQQNSTKNNDSITNFLSTNDVNRLSYAQPLNKQEQFLFKNIKLGVIKKDTNEIVTGFSKIADISLQKKDTGAVVHAYLNAYNYSRKVPDQALFYNQKITDVYIQNKDFAKAIETKQTALKEPFVQNSTKLKAQEITSLAAIYALQNKGRDAIDLLKESFKISTENGHTLQAKESVEKLDSIFTSQNKKDSSLLLYKKFVAQLPSIIEKDSSLIDGRIISATETRIRELEGDKALKDDLIRRKNIFNYWLMGSLLVVVAFTIITLLILKKLRVKNKKIALQSLRREMNPHFIFNSLNSINQFISNNNELAANQYLTKFSMLMRRVMENSKEDFVLFSKELELLQHYLELEKSRFSDKFDFSIEVDDSLLLEEQLYIPGMLIQPYIENAVWHGLRYMDKKGFLKLSFNKNTGNVIIVVEDNGIGMAESKKNKTSNQKKHSGRGITNTLERIKILNQLYNKNITCKMEDKAAPQNGVRVEIIVPVLNKWSHED
ncbi:tetratricopeptide repeat-containing sensor histidine kinase [Ferruginibacter albus]|uniref:tetratricopeptide repeat-containing sensor histidine kinase n=1 Tax=Ferruginibacter albus TaxID=2875540 RepID=UPI001CC827F9|nr:histidine kinase [Ferruginibacter albus]UAY52182.1 histidine kinase [Ferruginibacter albus]